MRTNRGANALFPEIRKRLLAALLMQPARSWYASDLARLVKAPKTSLQRELSNLHAAGIIRRRAEGKHVYYQADQACPYFAELKGLMTKTAGLVDVLREALRPFSNRISFAFVYGSIARGEEDSASDVDLMVVGDVGLAELAIPLRKASEALARHVSPTVFAAEDLVRRVGKGEGFVAAVLKKPKLFVAGEEHDLEGTLGTEARRARADGRARDRRPAGVGRSRPRRRHA